MNNVEVKRTSKGNPKEGDYASPERDPYKPWYRKDLVNPEQYKKFKLSV